MLLNESREGGIGPLCERGWVSLQRNCKPNVY